MKSRILLIFFLVTHLCSCIWLYLGICFPDSWLKASSEYSPTASSSELYLMCYYWIVTTLTSVGYGDFSGNNTREYLFQLLVLFLGMAYFSFMMGAITIYFTKSVTPETINEERVADNIFILKSKRALTDGCINSIDKGKQE